MPEKITFSRTFQTLENAIRIIQKRHGVIISNISNANTPGYSAQDIDFKKTLFRVMNSDHKENMVRTHPAHLSVNMKPVEQLEIQEENGQWNGLNRVNMDKEMTRLMENNLMYRTTVETLLRKLSILKEVIKEGGR
jgi:flagellar basal-body rod protein FlgB